MLQPLTPKAQAPLSPASTAPTDTASILSLKHRRRTHPGLRPREAPRLRIVVDHAALAPALAVAARAVPARSVRPVLNALLLTAADGHLTVTGTDLETTIVATTPASVEIEGRAALPARYLTDLMRRIPSGTLEIGTDPESGIAKITWGRSHFTVHGFSPADYPTVPAFPTTPQHTFPQRLLRDAISHTAFAAAQGETARALLTGVELRLAPQALFALATDGFQAAVYASDPNAQRPQDGALVVPASVLQEIARILTDSEEPCDVALDHHQIMVRSAATHVAARILEGKYFAVLDLVPTSFPTRIRSERHTLLGALERMATIAEAEAPYCVLIDVTQDGLQLSATRPDVGSAQEELPANVSGPALHIGFNVRQSLDGLRRFTGREILLEISGPKSLSRWSDPDDQRFQHLQMPLEMPD